MWVCAAAALPPAQQWLTQLIAEAHQARGRAAGQPSVLAKLKNSFAIATMSTQAYGSSFARLKPEARQAYLRLMETFFEKAVIKALFHAKAGEEKVTYKIFPIKAAQGSECAEKIVGAVDYQQRVDWTVKKTKADPEVYETKFCIRDKSKTEHEIVDIVVEGVSWVQDLADEIERFYQEKHVKTQAGSKDLSIDQIHEALVQRLQEKIQRLDVSGAGSRTGHSS